MKVETSHGLLQSFTFISVFLINPSQQSWSRSPVLKALSKPCQTQADPRFSAVAVCPEHCSGTKSAPVAWQRFLIWFHITAELLSWIISYGLHTVEHTGAAVLKCSDGTTGTAAVNICLKFSRKDSCCGWADICLLWSVNEWQVTLQTQLYASAYSTLTNMPPFTFLFFFTC